MLQLPKGTFLCWGDEATPVVRTLGERQFKLFYDRAMIVDLRKAVEATFGKGIHVAVPMWQEACIRQMAEQYEGTYQMEVRGLCAAVVLGIPFEDLRKGQLPGAKPRRSNRSKPADPLMLAVA